MSRTMKKIAMAMPTSPIAFITNAFLAAATGASLLVPEPDQQVGREADQAPAGQQQHEVAGHHQQQHREQEQVHVGEEAPLLGVAVHVADRVHDDQRADAGHDQHLDHGQLVDLDRQRHVEHLDVVSPGPGVERVDVAAGALALAEDREEHGGAADERGEGDGRGQPGGGLASDPVAGQGQHDHAGQRQEQTQPGERFHQCRSAVSRSTSSSALRRATATTSPRPTTTSEAAMPITISANTWPLWSPQ